MSEDKLEGAPPNHKKRRPRNRRDSKVPVPDVNPDIDPRENPSVNSLNSLPSISPSDKIKDELRKKLKENLYGKKLGRMTAKNRTDIIDTNMESMGIDMGKLKEDIEALNKQGGFTLNIKN